MSNIQYIDQNLSCIRLIELEVLRRVESSRRPRNDDGFREYRDLQVASYHFTTSQKHQTALEACLCTHIPLKVNSSKTVETTK